MQVSELIVNLKQLVDESTTGSYPTDAECMDWFNEAQYIIAEETGCFRQEATGTLDVTSATTLDVPSDWIRGEAFVWDTDGAYRRLRYVEVQDLLESGYNLTTTGTPSYWYIYNDYIQFYPVPSADASYKIWYLKAPPELTATSASPELEEHWQRLLVIFAAYRFWMKEEEPNMAAGFWGEFREGLTKLKMTKRRKQARKQYRVHNTAGSM